MSSRNSNDQPRDPRGRWVDTPGSNQTSSINLSYSGLSVPSGDVDQLLDEQIDRKLIGSVSERLELWESIGQPETDDGEDPINAFRAAVDDPYIANKTPHEDIRQWEKEGRPDTSMDVDPTHMLNDALRDGLKYDFQEQADQASEVMEACCERELTDQEREQLKDDAQRFSLEAGYLLERNGLLADDWGTDLWNVRNGYEPEWWNDTPDSDALSDLAREFPKIGSD